MKGHTGKGAVALDELIVRALSGDRHAQSVLPRAIKPYALKVIAARAGHLPKDLHEDVLHEALLLLMWTRSGTYSPTLGTPRQFFRLLLLDAIRTVTAGFTPAGETTRQRKKTRPATVGEGFAFDEWSAPAQQPPDGVQDPEGETPYRRIEAAIDSRIVLATAPPDVATALRRIYLEDIPLEVTARDFGVSRFVLRRHFDAFAARWRSAA